MNQAEIANEKLKAFYANHFYGEKLKNVDRRSKNGDSHYIELAIGFSIWYEWWHEGKDAYFVISKDYESEAKLKDDVNKNNLQFDENSKIWKREDVLVDEVTYQGANTEDGYAYLSCYMKADSTWEEQETCLNRFFTNPIVHSSEKYQQIVAQRIVANMEKCKDKTDLQLIDPKNAIGKDNDVLFIQYKPKNTLDGWVSNGFHYEFRIEKNCVKIEFHSESKILEKECIESCAQGLKPADKKRKYTWLCAENYVVLLSQENPVKLAVERMVKFEKEYGCKILNLIGQDGFIMLNGIVDLLKNNHNIILHGAPGTGKTYLAKEIASEMILGKSQSELNDNQKKQLKEQTGFVQFHQSYDYTDFVEGLRPKNVDGKVAFERKDGVFKEFCEKALKAKAVNSVDNFDECFDKLTDYLAEKDFLDVPLLSGKGCFRIALNSSEDGFVTLVPKENGEYEKDSTRFYNKAQCYNVYRKLPGTPKRGFDNYRKAIVKEMKKTFGLKEYVAGNTTSDEADVKNFVFIIDEINRGEMSKIFGELFFSIDPGYRGKDGAIPTQYANMQGKDNPNEFDRVLNATEYGHFFVPENVYIIGTMNDIDRSVESMDFAMRRRFAFKEIKAEDRIAMLDDEKNGIGDLANEAKLRMDALNKAIWDDKKNDGIAGLSSAYHIGPAYFLKLKNYKEKPFKNLWEYHLEGVLREYLRGMPKATTLLDELKSAYDNAVKPSDSKDNPANTIASNESTPVA